MSVEEFLRFSKQSIADEAGPMCEEEILGVISTTPAGDIVEVVVLDKAPDPSVAPEWRNLQIMTRNSDCMVRLLARLWGSGATLRHGSIEVINSFHIQFRLE